MIKTTSPSSAASGGARPGSAVVLVGVAMAGSLGTDVPMAVTPATSGVGCALSPELSGGVVGVGGVVRVGVAVAVGCGVSVAIASVVAVVGVGVGVASAVFSAVGEAVAVCVAVGASDGVDDG